MKKIKIINRVLSDIVLTLLQSAKQTQHLNSNVELNVQTFNNEK